MTDVSIRELRNHGGDVVDRAQRGERMTITKAGKPVAQLVALPPVGLSLEELRRRRALLPNVDPDDLRSDIDSLMDSSI
ncbi:MAG: type II toxin-antitoxin system prevent-host-death family antitoxin [Microthrixaceae bacterium]